MHIVMAAAESAPFSVNGGLPEMVWNLSRELARGGDQVTCILPLHASGLTRRQTISQFELRKLQLEFDIPIGMHSHTAEIYEGAVENSKVRFLLVDQPEFFDRPGLYQEEGEDYRDNCERFTFFSRSVLEVIRLCELQPDVIHAHDWPTGLVPVYLNTEYATLPGFSQAISCFTVHDLAYQGIFWHWDMVLTGLDWKYFNWKQLEFFGNLNLLKGGIVFADQITITSPAYAMEVQTPDQGMGLQGLFRGRHNQLQGILNGLDPNHWSPSHDSALTRPYGIHDVKAGKSANKATFQKSVGLSQKPDTLLVAAVGPFDRRSGGDLLWGLIEQYHAPSVQFALLGPFATTLGEHDTISPSSRAVEVFHNPVMQEPQLRQLLAAADVLLLPHRTEPAGRLAHLGSAYGTIPIACACGGHLDVLQDVVFAGLDPARSPGFLYSFPDVPSVAATLERARLELIHPETLAFLRLLSMRTQFPWSRTADSYRQRYLRSQEQRAQALRQLETVPVLQAP